MGKVNALLTERLKKTEHSSSKMTAMAHQSANGQLTSFSGVFSLSDLSEGEKTKIESILKDYIVDNVDITGDLKALLSITSEVKAIGNQAALLHGERIKKAHTILTRYRDGAFTAWLLAAYGNRQTPYNLMQYYEFCEMMPKTLRFQIESMPRQAIYTLASREGDIAKKRSFVEEYNGETKLELLNKIRLSFPLDEQDGRRQNIGEAIIKLLKKTYQEMKGKRSPFSKNQKDAINTLLEGIQSLVK